MTVTLRITSGGATGWCEKLAVPPPQRRRRNARRAGPFMKCAFLVSCRLPVPYAGRFLLRVRGRPAATLPQPARLLASVALYYRPARPTLLERRPPAGRRERVA